MTNIGPLLEVTVAIYSNYAGERVIYVIFLLH